jgi:single-stranded DNA-specific DHH superfamily exonuclease
MNKLFGKAIDFLREGKKSVIIFDTDGDGIGAAVILAKSMKRAFNISPKIIPRDHKSSLLSKDMLKRISGKFDLIVFLDMAVDETPDYITHLAKNSKVIIIDHHQVQKNLNSEKNIIHMNSSFWQKRIPSVRYCTSKMVYDLAGNFMDIGDLDWLAALGIINDKAEKTWDSFLDDVYDRNRISQEQLETVNNIVTSSYQFSKNKDLMVSFQACLEAISPFDILNARTENSKKLKAFYDVIQNEIESIMSRWRETAEIMEDKKLIMIELDTKYSISSTISTLISFGNPHYTVMISRISGNGVSISLRRQDKKVDCSKMAKKLIVGLQNASGGGHIPAAGIKIMKKDWKLVRKRAQDLL